MVRAIGNAVPARAGYVVALPLLIAALENGDEQGLGDMSNDNKLSNEKEGLITLQEECDNG